MTQQSLVKKAISHPSRVMPVLEQERAILTVAAEHDWPFHVLGVAPVPAAPVFHNQWWLVPIAEDHSQIPARALERVQAIYAAGIRPKAFVIAHEAPAQLAPPPDSPRVSRWEFWGRQTAQHSVSTVKVLGQVAAVVVPIALTVLGATGLLALGLASVIILTDPCLIVVTEDNVWIQVDFWMA